MDRNKAMDLLIDYKTRYLQIDGRRFSKQEIEYRAISRELIDYITAKLTDYSGSAVDICQKLLIDFEDILANVTGKLARHTYNTMILALEDIEESVLLSKGEFEWER